MQEKENRKLVSKKSDQLLQKPHFYRLAVRRGRRQKAWSGRIAIAIAKKYYIRQTVKPTHAYDPFG